MTNQKQDADFRYLTQEEIDAMSKAEEFANQVGYFIQELEVNGYVDKRWLAIAKNDLQKAFMSLTRSIAKPNSF